MRFRILLLFVAICMITVNTGCERTFSCTDGLQNQGETGIDCGGPCLNCGFVASCFDGIQNQDETDIDCGGVFCPDCPGTCTDGVQNQDEEGIDCGGVCDPCGGGGGSSCSDGIMNGDETGVDCGGSCPACTSCTDGIQNGNETGVDCGGPDCSPCAFGCGNPDTSNDVFSAFIAGSTVTPYSITVNNYVADFSLSVITTNGMIVKVIHSGALMPGTYPLAIGEVENFGQIWSTNNGGSGTITFDTYDSSTCTTSGSFEFNGINDAGSGLAVTDGVFDNIDF